jgi:hypothetical protein
MKMDEKENEDYIYYNVSVPNELRLLFELYIRKYRNLGYKRVSQFILNILQTKAEEINKENPDLREIKEIKLPSGTYILQEDGKYKKIK